jgi:hypothetical protein
MYFTLPVLDMRGPTHSSELCPSY